MVADPRPRSHQDVLTLLPREAPHTHRDGPVRQPEFRPGTTAVRGARGGPARGDGIADHLDGGVDRTAPPLRRLTVPDRDDSGRPPCREPLPRHGGGLGGRGECQVRPRVRDVDGGQTPPQRRADDQPGLRRMGDDDIRVHSLHEAAQLVRLPAQPFDGVALRLPDVCRHIVVGGGFRTCHVDVPAVLALELCGRPRIAWNAGLDRLPHVQDPQSACEGIRTAGAHPDPFMKAVSVRSRILVSSQSDQFWM